MNLSVQKSPHREAGKRYTNLVCVSDDPGEAAASYFIFKLMGYPYVKVWLNN